MEKILEFLGNKFPLITKLNESDTAWVNSSPVKLQFFLSWLGYGLCQVIKMRKLNNKIEFKLSRRSRIQTRILSSTKQSLNSTGSPLQAIKLNC
ncbi:hypothetical protein DY000_02058945 [Brassica cretica]|uniref:FBD domain-containing protein n=1 Tax=Brassica cretica TaxID=69181 RepID=A0ABQ7ATH2_BRACR|nr:hypothetical protein DY000_02058945 [Brassica cretica]